MCTSTKIKIIFSTVAHGRATYGVSEPYYRGANKRKGSDKMSETNRDFKGVWIPKEIWLDKRLNALDKIILAEIDSLDNDESGCFASNKYIAEFCGCSETKVSTAVSKLIELGYLSAAGFDGRQRKLKSCLSNFERQGFKNCKAGFQNLKDINIDNNINNISSDSDDDTDGQLSLTGEDNAESTDKPQSRNARVISVSVKEAAEAIYKQYPRKEGRTKGFEEMQAYLKRGRNLAGIGTVRFNHEQLYCAVRDYAMDCSDKGTEKQYIQLFSTFMNKTVIDYAEKSESGYEKYMERKYGSEWRTIKFVYK